MFYTTEEYMRLRYERFGRQYAHKASSAEEHEEWYADVSRRLADIIGLSRCLSVEPNPVLLESARFDANENGGGFTRERWLIETEPTVFMPFYLLVPDEPNGAAMINPHGHGGGKDLYLGFSPSDGSLSGRPESFGVMLARHGFHVAAPDARGAGERRERGQQKDGMEGATSHREILNAGICLGITPLGGMVWDIMRLVDFLSRRDGIDPSRIGCAGMSGGGMQTIYAAALDRRIALAITSGYFYGFRDALMLQPANCGCNFAPYLYETVDMGDIGAMIAPRPFFIESGVNDHLNGASGIDNVYSQVRIARGAYGLFGADEKLVHSVHTGVHEWVGDGMLDFIKANL